MVQTLNLVPLALQHFSVKSTVEKNGTFF